MIELLIVVAVMVILIGIALPVMKTGIEGRKLGEAARQLNTGITLAKALAAEKDRFTALVIDVESLPEDTTKLFARRLYLAETPPPYAGDMVGATATVRSGAGATAYADVDINSSNLNNVAKVGDLIRFDYRNPYYSITSIGLAVIPPAPAGSMYTVEFTGSSLPPTGVPLSYEIIRSPEKSSSTPFELPNGAVVDLNNSGFGLTDLGLSRAAPPTWSASTPYPRGSYCQANGLCYYAVVGGISGTGAPAWPTTRGAWVLDGTAPNVIRWQCVAPRPVTVVFAPSGRMMGVTGLTPPLQNLPTETLHLLVGELENIGALNLANRANLWVSVGHHTGRITTAENGVSPPPWTGVTPYTAGTYCQPTAPNGLCYIATVTGISDTSEPTPWPIDNGATIVDGTVTWECRSPAPWAASSTYLRGVYCRPTPPNGFCYVVRVAGISGGAPPAWPTALGETVVDGGPTNPVVWECTLLMGPAREFAQSAQAMGGL